MSHDDEMSEFSTTSATDAKTTNHTLSADAHPIPVLISKKPDPNENPSYIDRGSKHPEVVVRSVYQLEDDLLIRSWLMGKSNHTRRAYLRISSELLRWIHPRSIKEASVNDLQSFVDARVGQKKNTVAQKTAAVKSLFSFAYKSGYVSKNLGVFVKGIKGVKRLTERYLTEEEVKSMIVKTTNDRDLAILRLLYNAGLRVSELVALNWNHIQERKEGEAQIKILGKGEKERVVMISKSTYDSLKTIRSKDAKSYQPILPSSYGIKTRITDRTVREVVFKAAVRAGVEKRASPHWLRHSHASHALDHGAPLSLIKETFGHASIATTSEYMHARPNESSGRYLKE